MTRIDFQAPEYHADRHLERASYRFDGSVDSGWSIARNGRPHLELGPGYRLLRTQACGICSTDLARHFLPFPLPQVTGHELVATDEAGQRYVVEINASHQSRGIESDCPFCNQGLSTHCPGRVVLGIHDLPGGFGPWVLAPIEAALPVPDAIPTSSAVLIEPFAAALHGVATIFSRGTNVEQVAVLGPRRLGQLIIAALAGWRASRGLNFEILALSRHEHLLALASELGATETRLVRGDGAGLEDGLAQVLVDATGSPTGLALALRLAREEVHLKSTHGQPACGLAHLTELVVDELSLAPLPATAPELHQDLGQDPRTSTPRVAWLTGQPVPDWLDAQSEVLQEPNAERALELLAQRTPRAQIPRADAAVAASSQEVDAAIRPRANSETALIRPRGTIWIHPSAEASGSPLVAACASRGLRLSSSRCGDFRAALALMASDPALLELGDRLVTHHFDGAAIAHAFDVARGPDCIKAVIELSPTDGEAIR